MQKLKLAFIYKLAIYVHVANLEFGKILKNDGMGWGRGHGYHPQNKK